MLTVCCLLVWRCRYVEQFDTLLGILTVEEMLLYTAELKRPIKESLQSKREAVDEVKIGRAHV